MHYRRMSTKLQPSPPGANDGASVKLLADEDIMRHATSGVLVPLFVLLFALCSCSGEQARFTGIDLTGSKQDLQFSLTDVDGKERTLADFRGSYVMVFFGFTQCPDVCPTTLARAAEVRKKLGADGAKVKVVFISVDPERDTAELLRDYLRAFDPEFVGLRGTAEQTRVAAKALNVFYEKAPSGSSYTINHTAITYIFDSRGELRLGMRNSQEADDYVADLRILMKQRS